jgi:uncharacterized protein
MFTWDKANRRANLRKHGIDFADAERIFRGFTLTAEDTREAYGEGRFLTLGLLERSGGFGCAYRARGRHPYHFNS